MRKQWLALLLCGPLGAAEAGRLSFVRDIKPILERRCVGCHSATATMGSLNLESWEGLQRGGNSGPILVPGKSKESTLYLSLIGKAPEIGRMPFSNETMPEAETNTIREWIDDGASAVPATAATPALAAKLQQAVVLASSASAPSAAATVASTPAAKPALATTPAPATAPVSAARPASLAKPAPAVKPALAMVSALAATPTPAASPAAQIYALAWRPDAKAIALGGYQSVRLMDATGQVETSRLAGHADAVRALAWSKDGTILAAAGGVPGRKGEVKIWKADGTLQATVSGHSDCIYGLAISPDGKTIATSSYDKLIKLWDAATGQEIRTLKDHIDAIYALDFSPDGKRLVSGAADRSIKVWNPETGERLFTMSEPTDGVNSVAVSPDGKWIAAAGQDKSIRVWALEEKGATLKTTMIAHEDAILRIAWSRDGKTLLSSSADRSLKLFRASDLKELKMIGGQPDWSYAMEYSPDGSRVALGRMNGTLIVTEVKP